MSQNKYKFNSKDHFHLIWKEDLQDYTPLTGTTTILEVMGKNLAWWAAELSAVECLEAGEKIPGIRDEYLKACESGEKKKHIDALQVKYPIFKKARFAHYDSKNQKAEEGTDMHAELEKIVKTLMSGESIPAVVPADKVYLLDFMLWAKENVKEFIASEVNVYDETLFVGGIVDCIARLKDDTIAIIDFKSSKEAYFNHFVQTALYAIQLKGGGYDEQGNKTLEPLEVQKLIVIPFGAKKFKPAVSSKVELLKKAAEACISLYRVKGSFEKNGTN